MKPTELQIATTTIPIEPSTAVRASIISFGFSVPLEFAISILQAEKPIAALHEYVVMRFNAEPGDCNVNISDYDIEFLRKNAAKAIGDAAFAAIVPNKEKEEA